ncbi:hypothetical protein FJTKL_07029 [Diaporthe vaccinii]|uniref:Uncharacterized protein n=1 Tax=Diaporthe vaccinii TaxID=105482 RepID=A0ABR4EUX1_9PEZI
MPSCPFLAAHESAPMRAGYGLWEPLEMAHAISAEEYHFLNPCSVAILLQPHCDAHWQWQRKVDIDTALLNWFEDHGPIVLLLALSSYFPRTSTGKLHLTYDGDFDASQIGCRDRSRLVMETVPERRFVAIQPPLHWHDRTPGAQRIQGKGTLPKPTPAELSLYRKTLWEASCLQGSIASVDRGLSFQSLLRAHAIDHRGRCP